MAETRLHPIQGTMKLRDVIPLSNGSIAVRDTSCIYRQCYNDGVAYFASGSGGLNTHTDQIGAEPSYRARVMTFGGNVAEPFIHKEINGINNE